MNVRIEGNCKKPTKQWPNNLYYECEFIAEHYLNTLVKFWNFSHRISRLRAIDCSSCDCVSRHDDCSRGWDFISGVWPFSNFFLNIGRERRWPRWIKKASHIGSKRLCILSRPQCVNSLRPSDAKWRQRSGSTLVQVMACCLTAPSHYLNLCWLISEIQWQSSEDNFTRETSAINY